MNLTLSWTTLVFVTLLAVATGCSTTPAIRTTAGDLSEDLLEYRTQQKERIDALNKEYQDNFARLMDALVLLSEVELRQGRDSDAQKLADDLALDPNTNVIGGLRGRVSESLKSQREAIAAADVAVAQARANYTIAYRDLTLELGKLDKARKGLELLATPDDGAALFKNSTKVIGILIDVARKQAGRAPTSQPTTRPKEARPTAAVPNAAMQ